MDNLLYLSLNSVSCVSIIQNDKIKEGRGVCVCVCMCVCVRMINSLLWLILKWWNNDGVKSNIRLKTLKIWPACFICCRDRCTYADKIGSIGICLNNKIFSSVLLKWCQNYGISFEHSSRETGTATGWVQEWLKWWNHRSLLYVDGSRAGPCAGRQRRTASRGGFAVVWRTPSGHNVRCFHCCEKLQ